MLWIKSRRFEPRHVCPAQNETTRATGALDEGTFGVDAVMSWETRKAKKKRRRPQSWLEKSDRPRVVWLSLPSVATLRAGVPLFVEPRGLPCLDPQSMGEQRGAFVA